MQKKNGATVYQPETVKEINITDQGVHLRTDKDEYSAPYLMDISGRDSLLGKKNNMRQANKSLNNVAVFSHYTKVKRAAGNHEGDIVVGLLPSNSWTWLIPFKGEITSVGVVRSLSKFDGEENWDNYLDRTLKESPAVADLLANAVKGPEVHRIGNYSHTCDYFFGDRWILAGDAALFLDPIFSSGVHMSVSSSKLAAEALLKIFHGKGSFKDQGLGAEYEQKVRLGAKRFYGLISMFYNESFVSQMKRTLERENMRKAFTSVVAGDVWNEDNFLFSKNVI